MEFCKYVHVGPSQPLASQQPFGREEEAGLCLDPEEEGDTEPICGAWEPVPGPPHPSSSKQEAAGLKGSHRSAPVLAYGILGMVCPASRRAEGQWRMRPARTPSLWGPLSLAPSQSTLLLQLPALRTPLLGHRRILSQLSPLDTQHPACAAQEGVHDRGEGVHRRQPAGTGSGGRKPPSLPPSPESCWPAPRVHPSRRRTKGRMTTELGHTKAPTTFRKSL